MTSSSAHPQFLHITGRPGGEPQVFLTRTTRELPEALLAELDARVYVQTSRRRKTPRSLMQAMACGLARQIKRLLDNPGPGLHLGRAARRDAGHAAGGMMMRTSWQWPAALLTLCLAGAGAAAPMVPCLDLPALPAAPPQGRQVQAS